MSKNRNKQNKNHTNPSRRKDKKMTKHPKK